MNEYEISDKTYAVISERNKTKIIEHDRIVIVENDAYTVMDDNCKYYGSSYLGRLQAGKIILNCSYKIPILVEESNVLVFFPIKSSLDKDCCWLNPNGINNIEQDGTNSIVTFKNGKKRKFDVSKFSLENQIYKSNKLESIIYKRIVHKNREFK